MLGKRPDETHGRPVKRPAEKDQPIPVGFPGQMGLLAQQMNRGFGGGLLAQRNYLNQIYDPVRMPAMPTFGEDAKVEDPTGTVTGQTGDGNKIPSPMDHFQYIKDPDRLKRLEQMFRERGLIK